MGIIYNENVQESKIYQAYGLTVYGKINRYVWATRENQEENALTAIRIVDASGNDILFMHLGNNVILQSIIDSTIDNFLYWILEDKPDAYTIKKQVYRSLCASDCLFNHRIRQRKERQKREDEEKQRILERKKAEDAAIEKVKAYCNKNGFIPYFTYDGVYIIKVYNENACGILKSADNERMKSIINFMKEYPNNKDGYIVKYDTLENILLFIA